MITLNNDRQIKIATGASRRDMNWQTITTSLSGLYERLQTPIKGVETMAEYLKLKKSEQDQRKDVGGFVGGALSSGRRKASSMLSRDVVTLDFDTIPAYGTKDILDRLDKLGAGFVVYSTRKHMPTKPRLRILFPLSRSVSVDEYEPIARYLANAIGIQMADPTTFEAVRLMYWPSVCADGEYIFRYKDAPFASADGILNSYTDWRDTSSWPQVPGSEVSYRVLAAKQGDPLTKQGVVGAFCRTYTIEQAIEAFLPGVYIPVEGSPDRLSYAGGSTTGGAVLYDDGKFLYSHHATDPASGKLCNAFDLVRLHKFGDLDRDLGGDTPVTKLPSYAAMCEFAVTDPKTSGTLVRERAKKAEQDRASLDIGPKAQQADVASQATPTPDDLNWQDGLEKNNKSGQIKSTINNILLILEHDPELKGHFALNEFAGRGEVTGSLPWARSGKRRMWSDTDSNGLYWYMENQYGVTGRGNIDAALDIHASNHAFNEVGDYLDGLTWDGIPRLDTLFVDYLGAEDNPYTRAVTRKIFVAAVARALDPGCKYDNMVILCGPQGIGKSTILGKMSRGWFNDSLTTFEGKDASELLQGAWLVEVAELDALRRSEVSRIKQFLSLQVDRYRAAYGRFKSEFPRRCVFFGTCNDLDFLQDTTGNRRFYPVDVHKGVHKYNVFEDLTDAVIDQLWAEAKTRWAVGEPLFLSKELETIARAKQEAHRDINPMEGDIQVWLDKPVPKGWSEWSERARADFWAGVVTGEDIQLETRTRVCALEIVCEYYRKSKADASRDRQLSRMVNQVLAITPGWKRAEAPVKCGPYGKQRAYVREEITPEVSV